MNTNINMEKQRTRQTTQNKEKHISKNKEQAHGQQVQKKRTNINNAKSNINKRI